MLDETYINNIIESVNNGETFIGEYEDMVKIVKKIDENFLYLPYYKVLKIYKVADDFIIEAPRRE